MNKKLALKFNFISIVLTLLVAGSFIFTGGFFNKTSQLSAIDVAQRTETEEDVSASNVDLIASLYGWTESDPIVAPKKFKKSIGGKVFIIKFGTNENEDKYRLFMSIYHASEDIQLTTDFETDLKLIDELVVGGIKQSIVSGTDSENYKTHAFSWKYSFDTATTTVYKMINNDYEFTLTLAIADDDNFGKINLFASNENNNDVVYLFGSENNEFVNAGRINIDYKVKMWLIDRVKGEIFKSDRKIPFTIKLIAIIIAGGASIIIGVGTVVSWLFIRNWKFQPITSSVVKNKSKKK